MKRNFCIDCGEVLIPPEYSLCSKCVSSTEHLGDIAWFDSEGIKLPLEDLAKTTKLPPNKRKSVSSVFSRGGHKK